MGSTLPLTGAGTGKVTLQSSARWAEMDKEKGGGSVISLLFVKIGPSITAAVNSFLHIHTICG
ncbi:hypothetical protein AT746_10340 [Lacimicrobium alkaliphilum]|uniref:Uncharacterized protein n=1 Tax=Lacimicrobium alkaliphilum TaxID=1526571 RepID=A0A0U3AKY4_9ALTE|nr:hypothetical protein AT746_10340 [Lacimicrobium alkaliphilum]